MRYRLLFLSGPQAGRIREVGDEESEVVLGRDPSAQLVCDAGERSVSRLHAVVLQDGGGLLLRDLDSTAGTFLEGQDIEEAELADGDEFELGRGGPRLRVEFVDSGTLVARPTQPRPAPTPTGPVARALPAGARLRITVTSGARQGDRLDLAGSIMRIGRSPGSTVHLPSDRVVSFQHAKIVRLGGAFVLLDLESTNGTFLNGARIERARLAHADVIQVGVDGPALQIEILPPDAREDDLHATVVIPHFAELVGRRSGGAVVHEVGLGRPILTIGRHARSDLRLDSPIVSSQHARLLNTDGELLIEDLGSANGTYVGAHRVQRAPIVLGDRVVIGPFQIEVLLGRLRVLDTRNRARLDAVGLTQRAGDRAILDDVSLSIAPGSFVALIGPSGAGKSSLLRALCGAVATDAGAVRLNGLELRREAPALRTLFGFVPQDDLVHRDLTVAESLDFAARLRLPPDTSRAERLRRIDGVLAALELSDRADLRIGRLSGGQRKRVSIASELLTEPSLLFLDEPAAGLDPGLEESLMLLLRELSYKGRTVVLVTHSLDHVHLCDDVALLVGGRLAFFGRPAELGRFFDVERLPALYPHLKERSAAEWAESFRSSPAYHARVTEPQAAAPASAPPDDSSPERPPRPHVATQLAILAQRYLTILSRDARNMGLLLAQAPIMAVLIGLSLLYGASEVAFTKPTNTILLMLALSAVWFGCSNAAREIVKERTIYLRERRVQLGILPYLLSKLAVLGALAAVQCAILLLILGVWFGFPGNPVLHFGGMVCASLVGIVAGLALSALASSPDRAMTLLPILLMPQVLFTIPAVQMDMKGPAGVVAHAMPTWWSFELLRRVALAPQDRESNEALDAQLRAGTPTLLTRGRFETMFREGYPVFEYRSHIELTWAASTPDRLAARLPARVGRWRAAVADVVALCGFALVGLTAAAWLLRRWDRNG